MADASDPSPLERPALRAGRSWLWRHARTILLAVILAFSIRAGIAQAYLVEGPSMLPTLTDGQRVFVAKYAYGLTLPFAADALFVWALPAPGDVVILTSPLDDTDLVKRVVGLPGDTIQVRDDVVYRNGVALSTGRAGACPETAAGEPCEWREEQLGDHRWRVQRAPGGLPYREPLVVVPDGQIFVLGDHRDRSNDSRYFGPVPVERVRGRVVWVD
jgi:signal peptidase I